MTLEGHFQAKLIYDSIYVYFGCFCDGIHGRETRTCFALVVEVQLVGCAAKAIQEAT